MFASDFPAGPVLAGGVVAGCAFAIAVGWFVVVASKFIAAVVRTGCTFLVSWENTIHCALMLAVPLDVVQPILKLPRYEIDSLLRLPQSMSDKPEFRHSTSLLGFPAIKSGMFIKITSICDALIVTYSVCTSHVVDGKV